MERLLGYELLPWEDFGKEEWDDTPIRTGVKEIKEAGYTAFEALAGTTLTNDYARQVLEFTEWRAGPQVRSDVDLMRRLSAFIRAANENSLPLTTLFCEGEYINPHTADAEFDQAVTVATFIHAAGGRHLLVDGGPRRREPQHSADIDALAVALERIGRATADIGVELCFHPHIDTCVETATEVERFFNVANSEYVLMALDTAHITVGGGDPVQVLRDSGDRVRYIHLKDVDMALADQEGFAGTARYEAFRDLGEGTVDFQAFWREAERQEFSGPVIVELDISPDPGESARVSRRFVKDVLGF